MAEMVKSGLLFVPAPPATIVQHSPAKFPCRYGAIMAHIRQSSLDSGLGFQLKDLKYFSSFPLFARKRTPLLMQSLSRSVLFASANLHIHRRINAFIDTLVASSTHSQIHRHNSSVINTQVGSIAGAADSSSQFQELRAVPNRYSSQFIPRRVRIAGP